MNCDFGLVSQPPSSREWYLWRQSNYLRESAQCYRVLLEPEAVLPFLTSPRLYVCVCVCVSVCAFGHPTRHAGFQFLNQGSNLCPCSGSAVLTSDAQGRPTMTMFRAASMPGIKLAPGLGV